MSDPDRYLSLVMMMILTGTCPLSGGVPVWGRGKQRFLHKYLSMSGESVTFAPVKSRAHGIERGLRFSNVAESQYNTNIVHIEEVTFSPLVKKAVTPSFGSKNKQNFISI